MGEGERGPGEAGVARRGVGSRESWKSRARGGATSEHVNPFQSPEPAQQLEAQGLCEGPHGCRGCPTYGTVFETL